MAKESPWFKFKVNDWNTGDIQLISYHLKGVFIDLCAYYWSKKCLAKVDACEKKFGRGNFKKLVEEGVVKCVEGFVCIEFLDEQKGEILEASAKAAEKANKRWGKNDKNNECYGNATAMPQHQRSMTSAMRLDEIRLDEIRQDESEKEKIPHAPSSQNLIEVFFTDLPNSTFLEQACRDLSKPKAELLTRLPEFRKKCRTGYSKMQDFADHFKSWYRVTYIEDQTENPSKATNFSFDGKYNPHA